MAIRIACPHCGAILAVDETLQGQLAQCGKCRKNMAIPQANRPRPPSNREAVQAQAQHKASVPIRRPAKEPAPVRRPAKESTRPPSNRPARPEPAPEKAG